MAAVENRAATGQTGGAGRDRTGDLLNANQALSQLSYSPLIRKISNRGRLDADRKTSSRPIKERFIEPEKRETEALSDWPRQITKHGPERLALT